jgi:uncharacterized cupin superfamily protein
VQRTGIFTTRFVVEPKKGLFYLGILAHTCDEKFYCKTPNYLLTLVVTKPNIIPMDITIKKISTNEFRKMGINNWPIWEKDTSNFRWSYDEVEQFYLIQGKVKIKTIDGEYEVLPGDFVTCPKGLDCKWEIEEYVKKHYHFVEE